MDGPPLRSVARPLGAVVALHLALLLTWSVMVPTFRGADEHVHHDAIRHLTDTWRYPSYDGLDVSRRTLVALGTSPAFPAHADAVPADAATHRSERPGWADLGPDVRDGPANQMPQHPPLYYGTAAGALRLLDGDGRLPLDRAVWLLRLLNVLVLLPVPLLAADIAGRFSRSRSVVLAAAVGVLAVPQLTHLGATVSNDPLMVLLGSCTLAGAARLATGDRRWATAIATGVAAGLALFTKGFAIPLVPAVALACLLPLPRQAAQRRGTVARAAVVAAVSLALGGWWWVRNLVVHRNPQPGVGLRDRVPGVELDIPRFAGDFSERLVGSYWGSFGWREAHLPIAVSVAMTLIVVATTVVACRRQWARQVLVVPTLVAGAMVLSSGWGAFKKTGVSYATQGRYLFAGVAGVAALVALGGAALGGRRARRLPAVTLAVALALQALGLWVCLQRYWAGDGLEPVRAMVRFAPLPGPVTGVILVSLLVVAIPTLLTIAANPCENHGPDGPPEAPVLT